MAKRTVSLSEFIPDKNNANLGSERGQQMISDSLQEDGLGRSIVVDAHNNVVAGNKTLDSALKAGIDKAIVVETNGEELVVVRRKDWDLYSDEAPRRYAYRDNRSSEVSLNWNPEQILADMDKGMNLDHLFSKDEMGEILASLKTNGPVKDAEPQIDKAEELRQQYGVELGQVWELGDHRLVCGDCTDREVIKILMGKEKARMIFTDPPYGIGKDIENDNLRGDKKLEFYKQWTEIALKHVIENAYIYVWGYFDTLSDYWQEVIKPRGDCNFRNFIIWKKNYIQGINAEDFRQFPEHYGACLLFIFGQPFQNGPWSTSPNAEYYPDMFEQLRFYLDNEREKMGWDIPTIKKMVGHSDLSGDHWFNKSQWSMPTKEVYEMLQVAANGKAFRREYDLLRDEYDLLRDEYNLLRGHFDNSHGFTDVWEFDKLTTTELHPTVKPIEVCERGIETTSQFGELILDLFLGSGSTLLAAQNLNRQCRAIEIDPGYCAVAIHRWVEATGKEPRLV